jgi:serine/threonine protein kinase
MTEIRHCPQCGAELPPDAPEGVCPKCVLGLGFASAQDSDSGPESQGSTGAYHGPFTAPVPEELAKYFPQLEIIELLGQGGMGAVYKAREPALDRLVAVKILPPEAARDPAFAERFQREARALAKLNHPNIVAVYGIGQAEGLYYFIMEFVDGVNLRQLIRSGQCKPEQALRIVPQICEALQFAHDEGIVHRDIKPENILIDKRGRLKIADFGLARLFGHTRTDYTLTGPQQVMGTPNYMAPEQMDDPLKVDHRADIYSLGVVFYEMLTGELPRGRFAPPSQKVQVDVRLDEVVLRALEQQPERRYQQASEVKTDVETISRTPEPRGVTRPESAEDVATPVGPEPTPREDSSRAAHTGKSTLATGFWFLLGLGLFAIGISMIGKTASASPGLVFIIGGIGCWIGELVRSRLAKRNKSRQVVLPDSSADVWRPDSANEVRTPVKNISRTQQLPSPTPPGPQTMPPYVGVEAARHQLRGPAIGLLITGIIQCAVTILPAAFYTGFRAFHAGFSPVELDPDISGVKDLGTSHVQRPEPPFSTGQILTWGPDGPVASDNWARFALNMRAEQAEEMNKILQERYREYLVLEGQHSEHSTDHLGHQLTIIKPFAKPLVKLEDQLWSQLDQIIPPDKQALARQNLRIHAPEKWLVGMSQIDVIKPGVFGWGKIGARIEIWRVGTWYHWKVRTETSREFEDSGSDPQLPWEYRRFWKEPNPP